jgi:urease accessory protein
MSSSATLLKQRAHGSVKLSLKSGGIDQLREAGSAKVRLPPASNHAYLINTAGGLAGGDQFSYDFKLAQGTTLTVTSQAAERVYRTLGPAAKIESTIHLQPEARLNWLPHETILFDGASLDRHINVDMAENSRFLGIETTILGREASGETVNSIFYREHWSITCGGKLVHSDIIKLDGTLPNSKATLGDNRVLATIILIDSNATIDLERLLETIGTHGGVSAWNGKFVAKLIAKDGMILKKTIVSALSVLASSAELPKTWAL